MLRNVNKSDENGLLVADVKLNNKEVDKVQVAFNNTYEGEEDKEDKPVKPGKTVTVVTPKTGDDNNVFAVVSLLILSMIVMIGMFVYNRRRV